MIARAAWLAFAAAAAVEVTWLWFLAWLACRG